MRKEIIPSAESIAASALKARTNNNLPPVHLWDPPFCGNLDIRIKRDGTWFYLGTPIGRKELVKLFSSILKKEGKDYFLVTPIEKVGITVEDAPFLAVDFESIGKVDDPILRFETHVGDFSVAGADNFIRVENNFKTGEPAPYIHVRAGLEALIDRKTFYRLVDVGHYAIYQQEQWFGVTSQKIFFPIIRAVELN